MWCTWFSGLLAFLVSCGLRDIGSYCLDDFWFLGFLAACVWVWW